MAIVKAVVVVSRGYGHYPAAPKAVLGEVGDDARVLAAGGCVFDLKRWISRRMPSAVVGRRRADPTLEGSNHPPAVGIAFPTQSREFDRQRSIGTGSHRCAFGLQAEAE